MTLTWTTSLDATCLHAVLAAERGLPFLDASLGDAVGTGSRAQRLSNCRALLAPHGEEAFVEQLRLRSGPLREQWDARGPGLMRQIGELTGSAFHETPIEVALVSPLIGGHGERVPGSQLVTIEAVLANPCEQLPEVLRLAWLLAQVATAIDRQSLASVVLAAGEELELTEANPRTLELALEVWRIVDEQP